MRYVLVLEDSRVRSRLFDVEAVHPKYVTRLSVVTWEVRDIKSDHQPGPGEFFDGDLDSGRETSPQVIAYTALGLAGLRKGLIVVMDIVQGRYIVTPFNL